MSAAVHTAVRAGIKRIHFIAPTTTDFHCTTPFMKRLVAMDDVRITTGSTHDNAEHLSADFRKKVRELYEDTRLGRQRSYKAR
jgi:phage terminase large subunit-like protein